MHRDEPDFIVVGEQVALGALRRELAADHARWMNQLEVRRGLDCRRERDRTDSAPIGTAGLFQTLQAHGTASFGIAIGEPPRPGLRHRGDPALGVRRGAVVSRGQPTDLVIMDAIPEDFGASVLR